MQKLSRDSLEAIVGSIPAGVIVIEKDHGRTIYANECAIQLFGANPHGLEMLDHSTKIMKLLTLDGTVISPEQLPASIALLTGKDAQAEIIIERQDGSRVITAGSAKPIRDEKGDVIAAVAIFEDITSRKQAEEASRDTKENLHNILNATNDGVTLANLEGQVIDCNEAALKQLGLTREEFVGMNVYDVVVPEDRQRAIDGALKVLETGKILNQVRVLKKNGPSFYAEVSVTVLYDENKKPMGFVGVTRDITQRKQAEEALRVSEEKFSKVFEGSPFAITLTRLSDGAIVDVNDSALRLFGYTRNEILKKTSIQLRTWANTNDRLSLARELSSKGSFQDHEVILLKKDGTRFYVNMSGTIITINAEKHWLASFNDITEHKKIELVCKESEERFRGLVESTSDWIWQVNQNGVYTYVGPKVKEILGYEPEEVLGKTPFDLMPKDVVGDLTRIYVEAAKNKSPLRNLENLAIHKNGDQVVLETSGVPIVDEKGNLLGYRGIDRDITERKKVEQALRESEQLYHILFDNSEDGFMLLEPLFDLNGKACDFVFLKLNSAYERQTGARAKDVIGKRASEIAPELETDIAFLSGEVVKTGKSTRHEAYNRYSKKWYDSYFFPYAKGQVGILFRDVTERKKAEEALKESEKKFQNMIEQSPVVFELYDKSGFLIQVNPAWDKLWQIPREYVIGKFNILQSKQINEIGFIRFVKRAYAGETVLAPETVFDATLEPQALGTGRKRWLSSVIYPIKNVRGEINRIVIMHEDITEKKMLVEQLQDKERLATIGQTAGMVGHDLRNPLQTIIGEVYLAKSELDSLSDGENKLCLQESIRSIEEQVGYMDKIVSDLQTFVKPVEAQKQTFNLKPVVDAVIAQTDIQKCIQVTVRVEDKFTITADPQLLKRVLINLVTNALQAMPDGGKLTVKAERSTQGKSQIIIEDTGTGIPDEVKPKIYTPLFTTKSKGQGFGLAVCKRVLEAQGGTITFESEAGKGTKFLVELPK